MQIGFAGLLTLIFITLKLTSVITWSWWWILLPILWPLYVFVFSFILVFFAAMVAVILER